MKKIITDKKAILLNNDFNKEGSVHSECVELSVQFMEKYSQKYLEISGLRPYLIKITPYDSSKINPPFLALVLAQSNLSATRFCANNYYAKSIETVDLKNTWVMLNHGNVEEIEEINSKVSKKQKEELRETKEYYANLVIDEE